MAEKAPVYDYSKAREGASSAVPEPAAAAAGDPVVEDVSPEPAPKEKAKPARPSVKKRGGKRARPSLKASKANKAKPGARPASGAEADRPSGSRSSEPRLSEESLAVYSDHGRQREGASRASAAAASGREGAASPRSGETHRKLGSKGSPASANRAGGARQRREAAPARQRTPGAQQRDPRAASQARPSGARQAAAQAAARKGGAESAAVRNRGSAQRTAGDLPSAIVNAILGVVTLVVEFLRKPHGKNFNRAVIAVAAVVVSFAFIYPSAADYYIAVRNNAKSEAEYAALQEYYNQLKDDVETLNSAEGVEDAARDKYGMIMPGDVAMNVKDLDSEADFYKNPTEIGITPAGSVKAPEEWYTPFLDFFFGYEG